MEAKSNRELKSYNVPFSICLHLWTSDGELNFSEVALALIHDNLLVVLFHLHLPLLTGLEVVDEWGLFPRMPNVEDIVCNVSLSIPHDAVGIVLQKIQDWLRPREGVIIEWPLNGQFHDAVTVILTSRTAVSGVVKNVGNVVIVI